MSRAGAKIIGIVFNKVSEETAHSYGDYQYRALYSSKYYGDYISKTPKLATMISPSKRLMDFFEHGKVPPELTTEVESAITAIKTQPRNMFNRIRKPKMSENGNGKDESKAYAVEIDTDLPAH